MNFVSKLGGVIGSEPEPIESRQFNKDVNAAGIGIGGRQSNGSNYPVTSHPPISTVPPHPPTTEDYMIYVPNAVDAQFKIVNAEFLKEYANHDNYEYQTVAKEIEIGIMESLQDFKSAKVRVLNLT